jgi:hypothetical protein
VDQRITQVSQDHIILISQDPIEPGETAGTQLRPVPLIALRYIVRSIGFHRHVVVRAKRILREVERRLSCAGGPASMSELNCVRMMAGRIPSEALSILVQIIEVAQGVHSPHCPDHVWPCVATELRRGGSWIDGPCEGGHPKEGSWLAPRSTTRYPGSSPSARRCEAKELTRLSSRAFPFCEVANDGRPMIPLLV